MFLKNKNIIFKIRKSKVTDYAALNVKKLFKDSKWKSKFKLYKCVIPSPRMSRLRYFSSL